MGADLRSTDHADRRDRTVANGGTAPARIRPRTAVEPHPTLALADAQPNPTWPQAPRHLNEVERGDTALETNRLLAELLNEVRTLRLAVQRAIDVANSRGGR